MADHTPLNALSVAPDLERMFVRYDRERRRSRRWMKYAAEHPDLDRHDGFSHKTACGCQVHSRHAECDPAECLCPEEEKVR